MKSIKYPLLLLLALASSVSTKVYAQDLSKDSLSIKEESENSIYIPLKKHYVHQDHYGQLITEEAFSDSLKTKRFSIIIREVGDTSKICLNDMLLDMHKIKKMTIPASPYMGINKEKIEIGNNKPSLITFWSIHCGSCKQTLKTFDSLAKEFVGEVNFYAVSNDKPEDVQQFLSKWNIELQNTTMIIDEKKGLTTKLEIPTYPTHVIIGKDNRIEETFFAKNMRQIIKTLESLLKQEYE